MLTPPTARLDPMGLTVTLRVDIIRTDTLEGLARAWRDNPVAITDALETLAATLPFTTDPDDTTGSHPATIHAAHEELEARAGLGPADTDLTHDQGVRLRDQLDAAIAGTLTARIREGTP